MPVTTRRRFLKAGLAAGGGLLIGFRLPGGLPEGTRPAAAEHVLNPFLRINADDTVTIIVPRPELGQGVRTALPMIVAEELDAAWDRVCIEQADLDEQRYPYQFSGGSLSVRMDWMLLRQAGAAARAILVAAAAQQWGVAPSACRTERGAVIHAPTGRRLSYGALAEAAARLPLPEDPPLKSPDDFVLIGRRTPNLDAPAITRGTIRFGLDVRVPGMHHAAIARCPVFGGRVAAFDAAEALNVPGVHRAIALDADTFGGQTVLPNSPNLAHGVAVLASSTWAAFQGRDALSITWDAGDAAAESTASLRRQFAEKIRQPGEVIRSDGDVDRALGTAAHTLEAEYEVPFLAHVPMEPMNCVAHAGPDGCEVWAPTQNPAGLRTTLAQALALPPETIRVHPIRCGGAFGRRFYSDFALEAAVLSREAGAPVQVVWSREDDVRHDFYRPAGYHWLQAGWTAGGRLDAWFHRLVTTSRAEYLERDDAPAGTEVDLTDFPAEFVPNLRVEYGAARSAVPRGQWRAIADSGNVFAIQGFLDEVAHAAGKDPLEFRLDVLGPSRNVPFYTRTYDSGRLRGVYERAAEAAGWGAPLPEGHGRGIAGCYSQGSFAAVVADVSVEDGAARVHRVVAAIDCGLAVNPAGVEQQVAGSIIDGLSAALYGSITVENGRVQQSNFHDYPLLRIDACPAIEVHIIPSAEPPTGTGEPALPAVAPAVCNALFAATGTRIRRLPITLAA